MQSLLPLDVARSAVAQQFAAFDDETVPARPSARAPRVRTTRSRLARALRPTGAGRTAH